MIRGACIALSHGGGALPLLDDPAHANIVQSLKNRVPKILRLGTDEAPRAIVLVTAHWSEGRPTISSGNTHSLLYDYWGFPPECYKIRYDAPGSPELAREVESALRDSGLEPKLDAERGWDHGLFVPMLLINPSANVPIVQLSVLDSEDPTTHFNIGRAVSRLRDSNVAIIGSGFASHNMKLMFSSASRSPEFKQRNNAWSDAVSRAVHEPDVQLRQKKIESWRSWSGAYEMHPRGGAEHFLPLIVAAGAGGDDVAKSYKDEFQGLDMFSYYWE